MMIDKLQGINPVEKVSNERKVKQVDRTNNNDSIKISRESQFLSEAYLAKKIAMDAPEIREEKVAEMRAKLEDPNYINMAIERIASRLVGLE